MPWRLYCFVIVNGLLLHCKIILIPFQYRWRWSGGSGVNWYKVQESGMSNGQLVRKCGCVCRRSFAISVCLLYRSMQDVRVSCQTVCTTVVLLFSMMGWSLLCGSACIACLHTTHLASLLHCLSYRYWSCCLKRTSDFDEFLRQEGCTKGKHRWTGPVVRISLHWYACGLVHMGGCGGCGLMCVCGVCVWVRG